MVETQRTSYLGSFFVPFLFFCHLTGIERRTNTFTVCITLPPQSLCDPSVTPGVLVILSQWLTLMNKGVFTPQGTQRQLVFDCAFKWRVSDSFKKADGFVGT